MSKKFELQIAEPCHEEWDKMTPGDKGRFCDSCQKTVYDFTGMSDAQLIAFFKKPTGSVCGRFYNDQLERDFEIPRKKLPWVKYLFQFAIPVFLTSVRTHAQGILILNEKITPTIYSNCPKELAGRVGEVIAVADEVRFSGKVIDENAVGIPFASVSVKGTNVGTTCDSTGFFELTCKGHAQKIIVIVSSVGYTTVEKQINTAKDSSTEIILQTYAALSGEVVVTCSSRTRLGGATIRTTRVTYMEKLKIFFKSDSVRIFPNPAKAGSETKIEWRNADAGEYKIDLYGLHGQLIKSSFAKIESEINSFTFHIPAITPGSYLLRMTNKKSGKKHSEKIIIQ